MKNTSRFITILISSFLFLSIYTLFADYQVKGNLSATQKSSEENANIKIISRVGEPLSGVSTDSSISIYSGVSNLEMAASAQENGENLLSGENSALDDGALQNTPTEFRLYENYPNPFNPSTTIRFDIPRATAVTVKIYDIRGQEVASFLNGKYVEPGSYQINFDASRLSSGVYLYRITAGPYQSVKKMMLLK